MPNIAQDMQLWIPELTALEPEDGSTTAPTASSRLSIWMPELLVEAEAEAEAGWLAGRRGRRSDAARTPRSRSRGQRSSVTPKERRGKSESQQRHSSEDPKSVKKPGYRLKSRSPPRKTAIESTKMVVEKCQASELQQQIRVFLEEIKPDEGQKQQIAGVADLDLAQ